MSKIDSEEYIEKTKEKFDKQAEKYDSKYGTHAMALYDDILEKLDHFSFDDLLDIGCGTGNLLSLISSKYKSNLTGIDLSPEMLEIAHNKLGKKADLILGDSENLPFEPESFDMIICTDSFHHYPRPNHVLKGIRKVLKPGGSLLIADPWAPAPFRQIANFFFRFRNEGDVKIYSEAEILKLFELTGLNLVEYNKLRGKNAFIAIASK